MITNVITPITEENQPAFRTPLLGIAAYRPPVIASAFPPPSLQLCHLTAQWRDQNPGEQGNIRDQATGAQLVCLSNLENLNALFITQALPQSERLTRLNQSAIQQMKLLTADPRTPRLP